MLSMRGQYSLSLTAIMLFMVHSSSAITDAKLFSFEEDQSDRANYPTTTKIIVDNSQSIGKQQQPPLNLLQQLNLTIEQQQKIGQIHHKYKQQIRRKKNSLSILQKQLSDMIVGTDPVELIRAKNQQLVNLRQEIGALHFESILATREILTPQQRQKFRKLVESQLAQ